MDTMTSNAEIVAQAEEIGKAMLDRFENYSDTFMASLIERLTVEHLRGMFDKPDKESVEEGATRMGKKEAEKILFLKKVRKDHTYLFEVTDIEEWQKNLNDHEHAFYNPIAYRVVLIHMHARSANAIIERFFSYLGRVKPSSKVSMSNAKCERNSILGS